MDKELLFRLSAKDFTFQYYRGSGSGGQKKNKTSNCCRCIHNASGAVATSEEGRSQAHNRENAFTKCANTETFKKWHKLEVMRRSGRMDEIRQEAKEWAEKEINNPEHIKVEYYAS